MKGIFARRVDLAGAYGYKITLQDTGLQRVDQIVFNLQGERDHTVAIVDRSEGFLIRSGSTEFARLESITRSRTNLLGQGTRLHGALVMVHGCDAAIVGRFDANLVDALPCFDLQLGLGFTHQRDALFVPLVGVSIDGGHTEH